MGQTLHAWVMINSLIRLHFLNPQWLNARVSPIQVPVRILIIVELVVKFTTCFFNYTVFCLCSAKDELGRQLLFLLPILILLGIGILLDLLLIFPVHNSQLCPILF